MLLTRRSTPRDGSRLTIKTVKAKVLPPRCTFDSTRVPKKSSKMSAAAKHYEFHSLLLNLSHAPLLQASPPPTPPRLAQSRKPEDGRYHNRLGAQVGWTFLGLLRGRPSRSALSVAPQYPLLFPFRRRSSCSHRTFFSPLFSTSSFRIFNLKGCLRLICSATANQASPRARRRMMTMACQLW